MGKGAVKLSPNKESDDQRGESWGGAMDPVKSEWAKAASSETYEGPRLSSTEPPNFPSLTQMPLQKSPPCFSQAEGKFGKAFVLRMALWGAGPAPRGSQVTAVWGWVERHGHGWDTAWIWKAW